MTSYASHRHHDEDGMALIIALLFITILALVVGLLVAGAGGNLQATVIAKQQTGLVYADDAAIQWAINDVRHNSALCSTPSATATDLTPSLPPALVGLNSSSAPPGTQQIQSITCQGVGGTSAAGPLGRWAVYTTDTTANDTAITQDAGGAATIQGGDTYNRTGGWSLHTLILSQGNAIDGDKYTGTCAPAPVPSGLQVVDGSVVCGTGTPPAVTSPSSAVPNCAPYWNGTQWVHEALFGPLTGGGSVTSSSVSQPGTSGYSATYACATGATNPTHQDSNANGRTFGGCQVFLPGMYTTPPAINNDSYFASGLYYFDFEGGTTTWTISNNDSLFGGEPGSDTVDLSPQPCIAALAGSKDWDSVVATESNGTTVDASFLEGGTGVKWFFGGTSSLDVKNNASAELFNRVYTCASPCTSRASEAAVEGAPNISVLEVPATTPSSDGTGTWTSAHPSNSAFIWPTQSAAVQGQTGLDDDGGNNNQMVLHGAVYMPNSNVFIFATNQSQGTVQGGIDAWTVDLKKSAAGADLAVGLTGNSGNRVVLFVAEGGVPGNSTSSFVGRSAVAVIDNDNNNTTIVKSWRSVS